MPSRIQVGTAGWSIPRAQQPRMPGAGSHLERYARVLPAVEINSTFHRSHRAATFERWAASVPRGFRFSVKLPRTITHDLRLTGIKGPLEGFVSEIAPLGRKLGCVLVQLPPSLAFDARRARAFFRVLRARVRCGIALEPRHPSWFADQAGNVLLDFAVARVAADPAPVPGGGEPGGWPGLAYFRLHGSPRMYYSSYGDDYLQSLARGLQAQRRRRVPTWCIFDNTAHGAATSNALTIAGLTNSRARPDP